MLFFLFVAYGITFAFQNKLPFLYTAEYRESGEPDSFTDSLLHCTFCTGFHAGYTTFGLMALAEHPFVKDVVLDSVQMWASIAAWSFASAAFCYVADAAVKWLETNTE